MRFCFDAGHGGKDPGAIGYGMKEKDIVLQLALRVGELLAEKGVEVVYTRKTDVFVELSDRAAFANKEKADYFVSFHINAGGGTGFESYVFDGAKGVTLEKQKVIHDCVSSVYTSAGFKDRGMKQANLAVLRETSMPAILIEYGFIDNVTDAEKLKDQKWLERLAQATCAGLSAAFNTNDNPEPLVSEWAREAQEWVIAEGISDGTRPHDLVTREEVWTMLHRLKT